MPKKSAPNPKPPLLEWIMGGLGLLLTLAVLAVILREAMAPGGPPVLEPRLHAVHGGPGAWQAEAAHDPFEQRRLRVGSGLLRHG